MGGCSVLVTVEAGGEDRARAIVEALEPDNATAPPGMKVTCTAASTKVSCVVSISCREARDMLRLRNTVDDLLVNLRAALESIERASGRRQQRL